MGVVVGLLISIQSEVSPFSSLRPEALLAINSEITGVTAMSRRCSSDSSDALAGRLGSLPERCLCTELAQKPFQRCLIPIDAKLPLEDGQKCKGRKAKRFGMLSPSTSL